MPKKLTILGALTAALVFGYFGLFNGTSQGAIQTFTTSGATAFDWDVCYGGARTVPSGGGIGPGGSPEAKQGRDRHRSRARLSGQGRAGLERQA